MDHVTQIFQAEDLLDTDKIRMGITSQATSAGTISLSRTSTCHQAFTGTTAGQIIQLPNATTLTAGWTFFIWNESTKSISIKDFGLNALLNVPAKFNCIATLKDISTSNGYWLLTRSSPGSGGSGVTPPFIFSYAGGANSGIYLRTGSVPTSDTGQDIKGLNYIVEIQVSSKLVIPSNQSPATIQFQQRTGVSTFVDIVGASVTLTTGQYKGTSGPISVSIGPDWELACYVSTGQFSSPVAILYLDPQ